MAEPSGGMRRYGSFGDLPLGGPRRVVAIGSFDGVHLGHQAIVRRAVELARERGLPSMVLTFDPNPITVLHPGYRVPVLTTMPFRAALIERLRVDELLVVPFTRALARVRAERFAEQIISAPVGADAVVVGQSFRFGHGGAGTADTLRRLGRRAGLRVEVPDVVLSADGVPVSSTRIRKLVSQGRVAEATPLLGRPHSVEGRVVHGAERGRAMGLPTANVEPLLPDAAVPGRGVYAGRAVLAGGAWAAAINVGYAPTFAAEGATPPLRLEAFLLDYEGDELYGEPLRVEFLERLRDEQRFPSPDALVAQVQEDIRRTRESVGAPA